VLAVQRGTIPPNRGFETPNPHIQFDDLRLKVVATEQDWPTRQHVRRAGVSAFGFGGANAHVVLEQSPEIAVHAPQAPADETAVTSLVLTGKTPERVASWAARLADWIDADGTQVALADIAHTRRHPHNTIHGIRAIIYDVCVNLLRRLMDIAIKDRQRPTVAVHRVTSQSNLLLIRVEAHVIGGVVAGEILIDGV
jgi:acyl transferase domain-containing protein